MERKKQKNGSLGSYLYKKKHPELPLCVCLCFIVLNFVKILLDDAPDEYDDPDGTDFCLGPESGEITLVITKE